MILKPISLSELAVRAGVSPATASIVLNNRPLSRHVAEKTRARILKLADELDYRPNHLAKAMLQQSTGTIGFICGDIATPFYAELADELAMAAEKRGYRLMIQPTRWSPEKELDALELLLTRAVDGALVYSNALERGGERVERLCRSGRPLVVLGTTGGGMYSSVMPDAMPGMTEAFRLLCAGGPRDIAIADDRRFPWKYSAYLTVCSEFGCVPRCFDFTFGDRESMESCIDRIGEERPELVIVSSDYLSAILISRLGTKGIRVPEDLSVISIDGTKWAGFYNPPLTSIKQDTRELARCGIDELFRLLNGGTGARSIMVPTVFEFRQSVKLSLVADQEKKAEKGPAK